MHISSDIWQAVWMATDLLSDRLSDETCTYLQTTEYMHVRLLQIPVFNSLSSGRQEVAKSLKFYKFD